MGLKQNFSRAIIMVATLMSGHSFAEDLTSWTIRFEERVSIRRALTGCYGTSSYRYQLPTVTQVETYLAKLVEEAGGDALFFVSEQSETGDRLAYDSSTGKLLAITPETASQHLGVAACICRREYTQARHTSGAPNCSPRSALPPLGKTFLATSSGSIEEPPAGDVWTDSVTGWTWRLASVASNWYDAASNCGEGEVFPDYPTIGHAARRMWASTMGKRLAEIDGHQVWSSTEFEAYSAMISHLPSGNASATGKQWLYPVLCVKK